MCKSNKLAIYSSEPEHEYKKGKRRKFFKSHNHKKLKDSPTSSAKRFMSETGGNLSPNASP